MTSISAREVELPVAAAERVQRRVRRGGVKPSRRVGRVGRMRPIERNEHVLRDILSLGLIGEHAVGDADHARIFGPEKSLERR